MQEVTTKMNYPTTHTKFFLSTTSYLYILIILQKLFSTFICIKFELINWLVNIIWTPCCFYISCYIRSKLTNVCFTQNNIWFFNICFILMTCFNKICITSCNKYIRFYSYLLKIFHCCCYRCPFHYDIINYCHIFSNKSL